MSNEKRDNIKIALLLRVVRSALGLNLKEMAEVLGVGASTVGKFESNDLSMKAVTYMKFNEFLRVQGITVELVQDKKGSSEDEVVVRFQKQFISNLEAMPSKPERKKHALQGAKVVFSPKGIPYIEKE